MSNVRGKPLSVKRRSGGTLSTMPTTTFDLRSELPARLSPSRLSDYVQCPKLFYYKTILKLKTPNTVATTKGTLAHYAFEHIFDIERGLRTPETAVGYVRTHWEELARDPSYASVIKLGEDVIEEMLTDAERMVAGWFEMERVNNFNPVGRERWVRGEVGGLALHGVIDRLDEVGDEARTYISDYKTGKAPKAQYIDKAFFAMDIYTCLLEQETKKRPFELRLIYVKNSQRDDIVKKRVSDASVDQITRQVAAIGRGIDSDAKRGCFDPKTGPLCSWCDFQGVCPAFNPAMEGLDFDELVEALGDNVVAVPED